MNMDFDFSGLFLANPCQMSDEECAGIFEKSCR